MTSDTYPLRDKICRSPLMSAPADSFPTFSTDRKPFPLMFNVDSDVSVAAAWLPRVTAFLRHYRPSLKEFYNVGGYPFDHLVFFEKFHPFLDCSLVPRMEFRAIIIWVFGTL